MSETLNAYMKRKAGFEFKESEDKWYRKHVVEVDTIFVGLGPDEDVSDIERMTTIPILEVRDVLTQAISNNDFYFLLDDPYDGTHRTELYLRLMQNKYELESKEDQLLRQQLTEEWEATKKANKEKYKDKETARLKQLIAKYPDLAKQLMKESHEN